MRSADCHAYAFLPTLRLAVCGDATVLDHFDREYEPRLARRPENTEVRVRFGMASERHRPSSSPNRSTTGGHKSVRWTVELSDPGDRPLEATISLHGWPRSFGLSLVQGYFIEALLGLVSPFGGHALVPGAALVTDDGGVLMLGPSGAGKSSLSARAMAAGRIVIADDQVLIDAAGRSTAFPRRLRFYPDIAHTAPDAFRALRPRTRALLRARGAIDRITAGHVRPSLAVARTELNGERPLQPTAIRRVLLLEPRAPVRTLETIRTDLPTALLAAARIFELQRARFLSVAPPDWRGLIDEATRIESDILASAFQSLQLERVRIPATWPSWAAVDALAQLVGLPPQAIFSRH